MKYRKVPNLCLVTVAFVFLIWQMTTHLIASASADENRAARPIASLESINNSTKKVSGEPNTLHSAKPNDRAGYGKLPAEIHSWRVRPVCACQAGIGPPHY